MIASVAVVGAGTMGSGIAQVFAQAGFDVHLHDPSAAATERAVAAIARSLSKFVEKGIVSAPDRDAAPARIHIAPTLDRIAGAGFVVEAALEQPAVKQEIFRELDRLMAPPVILASNTSSIPIASLAEVTNRQDQVLGMHFMNPVPLMPLVEVIRSARTSDASMAAALDLCTRLGKTPVESADRPGFIANRILMPMVNEAVYALSEGVGTAEAIDTVMKLGMNHPMGPLALADLIGLDVCVEIMNVMRDGLKNDKYQPCPLLVELVAAGRLGRKSGRGFFDYPARP